MTPKISVLMSVYNGERYLSEAIESILSQSFIDFEFVIIDDCSTDNTSIILDRYNDSRIVRLFNDQNIGLTRSLNRGLQFARGQFIARQDADDISEPSRLSQQIAYLKQHSEIGVLGTQFRLINRLGLDVGKSNLPCPHSFIIWNLPFKNVVAHPTVMIRKVLLEQVGGYNPSFFVTQDYELWTRLIGVTRFANLPEALVKHRRHFGTVSNKQSELQRTNTIRISQQILTKFLQRNVPDHLIELLHSELRSKRFLKYEQKKQIITLHLDLYTALINNELIDKSEQEELFEDMLEKIISTSQNMSRAELARVAWNSILPNFLVRAIRLLKSLPANFVERLRRP